MSLRRIHFHSFDALRFIAFLLVFLNHVPVPENSPLKFATNCGGPGVAFFFVLSGFLISYILIEEKTQTGKIELLKYLQRRALRVFPLFYLVVAFAYVTPDLLKVFNLNYSDEGYEPNWLLTSVFLGNYTSVFHGGFPNVSPLRILWTVAVEMHFYVVWGIVINYLKIKFIPIFTGICIVLANLSRVFYSANNWGFYDLLTHLDYFAFGTIASYLAICKPTRIGKAAQFSLLFRFAFVTCATLIVFALPNSQIRGLVFIEPALNGILFSSAILFTLPQPSLFKFSDGFWMSKFGLYTFGLYVFHTIAINFFLRVQIPFLPANYIIIILLSFLTTLLFSYVSYHLVEKRFLELRSRLY